MSRPAKLLGLHADDRNRTKQRSKVYQELVEPGHGLPAPGKTSKRACPPEACVTTAAGSARLHTKRVRRVQLRAYASGTLPARVKKSTAWLSWGGCAESCNSCESPPVRYTMRLGNAAAGLQQVVAHDCIGARDHALHFGFVFALGKHSDLG